MAIAKIYLENSQISRNKTIYFQTLTDKESLKEKKRKYFELKVKFNISNFQDAAK